MSITDTKQDTANTKPAQQTSNVHVETKAKNASPSREVARQGRQDRIEQLLTRILEKHRDKVRLIPIWLKLVITIILMTFSLMAGAMVGYGVIGDGKPSDALKHSTWTHIIELINKEK